MEIKYNNILKKLREVEPGSVIQYRGIAVFYLVASKSRKHRAVVSLSTGDMIELDDNQLDVDVFVINGSFVVE